MPWEAVQEHHPSPSSLNQGLWGGSSQLSICVMALACSLRPGCCGAGGKPAAWLLQVLCVWNVLLDPWSTPTAHLPALAGAPVPLAEEDQWEEEAAGEMPSSP